MNGGRSIQRLWTPWSHRCPLLLHRARCAHGAERRALLRAWRHSRRDDDPVMTRVSAP